MEPRTVAYVAKASLAESDMETYDPKKTDTDVRGASPRQMNMRVLVGSMIGIIVLFAVVFAFYTLTQPNPS